MEKKNNLGDFVGESGPYSVSVVKNDCKWWFALHEDAACCSKTTNFRYEVLLYKVITIY